MDHVAVFEPGPAGLYPAFLRCLKSLQKCATYLRTDEVVIAGEDVMGDNLKRNCLLEVQNQFDKLRLWGDSVNLEEVDRWILQDSSTSIAPLISEILYELEQSTSTMRVAGMLPMIEAVDEILDQLNSTAPLLCDFLETQEEKGRDVQRLRTLQRTDLSEDKRSSVTSKSPPDPPLRRRERQVPQVNQRKEVRTPETSPHEHINSRDITTSYDEYFLDAIAKLPGPKCNSQSLSLELRAAATKKNGKPHDKSDENLLFPPSVIQKTLSREKVKKILGCNCELCSSVRGRDLLTDEILTDAITTLEGDEQRKLFALLVFIGAGFATRHICSFHTRGWDITARELSIRTELFEPLRARGIFPSSTEVTGIFLEIFKRMWPLFSTPKMKIENHVTNLTGENLPFLNERPLNADTSSFGSMFSFEIHPEFRDEKLPGRAVRKEIPFEESTVEERRILEFLARCGKPNFVQLLFWYKYERKVNYVFPHYPGSLHQLLEGNLDGLINPVKPIKYRSSLQHWLWQGMVEVTAALKFFHFPDQKVLPGQMIAAHFDLKPMNILVDESGTLIVTDFGQARIRPLSSRGETSLTAQLGDPNYRPPPSISLRKPVPTAIEKPGDPKQDITLRCNRAYDVWSLACIMTEVIEYITRRGSEGFISFRDRRLNEDKASAAFWRATASGNYEIKLSVEETLRRFYTFNDPYLNMITDLLMSMFSIDPLQRPPIADCLAVISEDVPTDEWPLKDIDEFSICGLGTNPQLRNMHTQFQRKSDQHFKRCKMYLLASTTGAHFRVVLEFDKEITDGSNKSSFSCVLSDSARRDEEEYKPLSLFVAGYKPMPGRPSVGAFAIIHHNLEFIFDEPQRGPDEYYLFLTAVTRQISLRPLIHIPISKCTIKLPAFGRKKATYSVGHVQIWRELTEDEFVERFTGNLDSHHFRQNLAVHRASIYSQSSLSLRKTSSVSFGSGSSGTSLSGSTLGSASSARKVNQIKTRRLVVFLSGSPSRLLTINLTNKFNTPRINRTGSGEKSDFHISFTAIGGNFHIGNFTSETGCPGIPLNPDVLASKENFHVDWIELEFQNRTAISGFMTLWDQLYPPNS